MSIFISTSAYGTRRVRAWVMVVLALTVLSGLIVGGWRVNFAISDHSCEQVADAMGRKYDYGTWKGCLVQTEDGTMIPLSNYRLSHNEGGK